MPPGSCQRWHVYEQPQEDLLEEAITYCNRDFKKTSRTTQTEVSLSILPPSRAGDRSYLLAFCPENAFN